MESVTGKPSLRAAPAGKWTRGDWLGLALGLGAIAAILATDLGLDNTIFGGVLVGPAFITALFARVLPTVLVGAVAFAVGAASPEWNMNFGESPYWIRLALIAGATA